MDGSGGNISTALRDILVSSGRIEATLVQLEKRIEDLEKDLDEIKKASASNSMRIAMIMGFGGLIGMVATGVAPILLQKLFSL